MPSKGTPFKAVRLDPVLVALVEETITRRNDWSRAMPWNFSDFVRIALTEKIQKMKRSRRRHTRPRAVVLVSGTFSDPIENANANS